MNPDTGAAVVLRGERIAGRSTHRNRAMRTVAVQRTTRAFARGLPTVDSPFACRRIAERLQGIARWVLGSLGQVVRGTTQNRERARDHYAVAVPEPKRAGLISVRGQFDYDARHLDFPFSLAMPCLECAP